MAQETYLVSAVLTGLLVVGVAVAVLRLRTWHHYTVQVPRGMATAAAEGRAGDTERAPSTEFSLPGERVADRLVHSGVFWYLGFVVLALGFGAATLLSLNGGSAATTTMLLLFVLVLGLYLPVGLYVALRARGHASARAVGETVIVLGVLLTIVVVGNLVGLG
jgi:hypothetical protein